MAYQVDVIERVTTKSINTQNSFEVNKRVLVTVPSEVASSFLVNIYALQLEALKMGALV